MTSKPTYSLAGAIKSVTCAVALLWIIQSAGVLFNLPLSALAVYPLEISRLHGVITSVLVHSGYEHLFNNTLPLLVLGSALMYGYPKSRFKVIVITWIGSGLGVWLFGRESNHLGASGLAHGLFFYVFVVSILRRDARSVALMMIAFFMYGTMVLTIFPTEPNISYEAHFFGGLSGFIAALIWWRKDPQLKRKTYSWENPDEPDDPQIARQLSHDPDNPEKQDEPESFFDHTRH